LLPEAEDVGLTEGIETGGEVRVFDFFEITHGGRGS
jgi:hypothetical protein